MKSIHKKNIFLNAMNFPISFDMVQFDTGNQLQLTIKDMAIPSGSTAIAYYKKPSGKFVYDEKGISVSSNVLIINIDNQCIAESGITYAQISVRNGNDIVSTFGIRINVYPSYKDQTAEESKTVVSAFDLAVEDAIKKIGSILDKTLSITDKAADAGAVGSMIKSIHDIDTENDLKALLDLIFENLEYEENTTSDKIKNIVENFLRKEFAAGVEENKIPVSKGNGIWDWGSINDVTSGLRLIMKIGLTLPDGKEVYRSTDSVATAINVTAAYLFNLITELKEKKASGEEFGLIKANPATEEDTQEIHINEQGYLVTTPSGASGTQTAPGTYDVEKYGVTILSNDNTDKIQELIDLVEASGGGTIKFGKGRYKINGTITLKPRIAIEGCGTATVLWYTGGDSGELIFIPKYSTGNEISKLVLLGTTKWWGTGIDNVKGDTTRASIMWDTTTVFGPNGAKGIRIEQSIKNNVPDGVGLTAYTVLNGVNSPTAENAITYKMLKIHDMTIVGFNGIGLYCEDNYAVNIADINIGYCGCGAVLIGTDNTITGGYYEQNAYEGMICMWGNSMVSNIKYLWNGQRTKISDPSSPYSMAFLPDGEFGTHECYGATFMGRNMKINNIESQDNVCSGVAFDMTGDGFFESVTADANAHFYGAGGTNRGEIGCQVFVKGRDSRGTIGLNNNSPSRGWPRCGIKCDYAERMYVEYSVMFGTGLLSGGKVFEEKLDISGANDSTFKQIGY